MPRPTRYPLLVVDAGNSAVKFASVAQVGALPKFLLSVPTAKLTAAIVKRAASGAKRVVISSVVPSASRLLKRAFPAAQFVGPRTPLGFRTLVDRQSIGSDRLANVAYAHTIHGGGVLVASFGTAATFDVLDAKGVHLGGAIAPGWQIFGEILSARTALLPPVGAKKPRRFIGHNTSEALAAGVGGGYAAMVSQLVTEMQKEAGAKKMRILFTGGEGSLVAKLTGLKAVTDPLLTLKGIAILADLVDRKGRK